MVYDVINVWKLKTKLESVLDILVLLTTFGSIVSLFIHFYINHSLETSLNDFYYLKLALEIGDFAVLAAWINLVFHLQIFPLFEQVKNFCLSVSWILLKLIIGFSLPLLVGFGLFFISRYKPGSKSWDRVYLHMLSNTFSLMFGNADADPYSIYFPSPSGTLTPYEVEVFVVFIMSILAYVVTNVLLGFSVDMVEHYKLIAEMTRIDHMYLMCKSFDTHSQLNLKKITIKKVSRNKTIYGNIFDNSGKFIEVFIPAWIIEKARKILNKKEKADKAKKETKIYRDSLDDKLNLQNEVILQQSKQIISCQEYFFKKQQEQTERLNDLTNKHLEKIEEQSDKLETQARNQIQATQSFQSEILALKASLKESFQKMNEK